MYRAIYASALFCILLFSVRAGFVSAIDTSQTSTKYDIVVGFRGLRSVTGGRNPSDGIDSAAQRMGGAAFEHTQQQEAMQYIMSRYRANPNARIVIMGHSAGANRAIQLARQLGAQNVKVAALVVADPSRGSAGSIPGNVTQAVGLFSNSPAYAGIQMSGGSPITNIRYPNLDHFGIDNLLEKHVPAIDCKINDCSYSGNTNCSYNSSKGTYECSDGALSAQSVPSSGDNSGQGKYTQFPSSPSSSGSGPGSGSSGSGSSGGGSPSGSSGSPSGGGPSGGSQPQLTQFPQTTPVVQKLNTPKETTEMPVVETPEKKTVEPTDPTMSYVLCGEKRIRYTCAEGTTLVKASAKPSDARFVIPKTKRTGIVSITPKKGTRYTVTCLRGKTQIAKVSCGK